MFQIVSNSPEETIAFAKEFATHLRAGDVVAFTGTLGAGKTHFTKGIASALGFSGDVYSPTFAIVNEYRSTPPIYHFDMYRISGFESLYSTGFFDFLDGNSVIVIEWSENISEFLPENTIFVDISSDFESTDKRTITVKGDGRFDDLRNRLSR